MEKIKVKTENYRGKKGEIWGKAKTKPIKRHRSLTKAKSKHKVRNRRKKV